MPIIRSKVIRVKDADGVWHDLPATVSVESIRAAERALASEASAAQSALDAQQTVDNADFIAFDVEDETGLLWLYRTDADSDVTFELNENTGELEVVFNA